MSYIFRLHSNGRMNLENWDKSRKITQTDIDDIPTVVAKGSSGKIGSSIPSVFARMQLFDTAFKSISNQVNFEGNTTDHLLISDCLDLLHFIYMWGSHEDVTYKIWNIKDRLASMESPVSGDHHTLSQVLKIFFNREPYNQLSQIVFIFFKGHLVGGTSPLTLVFTSPNWKRKLVEYGFLGDTKFKTGNENVLFDDTSYSIFKRELGFQKFVFSLFTGYKKEFSVYSKGIFKYVSSAMENPLVKPMIIKEKLNEIDKKFVSDNYNIIKLEKGELYSGKIPLFEIKETSIEVKSDFKLSPTVEYYKEEINDEGNVKSIPCPLLLLSGYNNPSMMHNGRAWDPQQIVPDIQSTPLYKRRLPENTAVKYPYVTTGDFFTDKLFELRFNLNNKDFYSPTKDKFRFLIPIRKKFFKFFTLEDLKRNLSYKNTGKKHEFILDIPVQGGISISISKAYYENDIIDEAEDSFDQGYNIGVFPFYKLENDLNKYVVGLVENIQDIELDFYHFNTKKIGENELKADVRTDRSSLKSRYYHVNSEFDLIEVNRNEYTGLVIPLWKIIDPQKNNGQYKFAIDFGTSNTHIAYTSNLPGQVTNSFGISFKDIQLTLLSELGEISSKDRIMAGVGQMKESISRFNQEFVPSLLSEDYGSGIPFRTVLYESVSNQQNKLFSDLNVGFGFHSSYPEDTNQYISNLKWFLKRDAKAFEKAKLMKFFEQILWMIKNKIVLNNGNLSPIFIYMVPLSMNRGLRQTIKELWEEAMINVFGKNNNVTIVEQKESESPYYAIPGILGHHNAINIDIGGGTSDILAVYKDPKKNMSWSYRFAGNDIWGDGLNPRGTFDSGFISMINENIEHIENLYPDIISAYNVIKTNEKLNSSDLSSLYFEHDEKFTFTHLIKQNQHLKSLLFVHLAGLIFHICKVLDKFELPNPDHLSFSGKGSEYLRIISKDISELIVCLFEVFREDTQLKIIINLVDRPKHLTAEGALRSLENDAVSIDSDSCAEEYYMEDIESLKERSDAMFLDFTDKLMDSRIQRELAEYDEDMDIALIVSKLKDEAENSFKGVHAKVLAEEIKRLPLTSPPFFWYLKHSIYNISKDVGV